MNWKRITFCDAHGDSPCDCERFDLDVLENDAKRTLATIYLDQGNDRYYGTVLPVEPFVKGRGWAVPPKRTGAMRSFPACQKAVEKLMEGGR